MPVPMIDLCRDKAQLAEVEAAVVRVVRSGHYILGPEVENLEQELAQSLGRAHVLSMSSGTDALLCALMALGIGPGDEVLMPTYSFFATAGVVARTGARPVFVDVEPVFLGIDPQRLDELLQKSRRPKAVFAVHLFGAPCDIDAVAAVCRRRGVVLIEDAAQAIGARWRGRPVGGDGLCAGWSTFPTKNLGGLGDGGFLTTDDSSLAQQCRLLRNHGQAEQYKHNVVGGNFRMDALQAAALRVKLRAIEKITAARRENAARYRALFAEKKLEGFAALPQDVADRHAYHQFVIRVPAASRDQLLAHLRAHGVGCAVYYPIPFHLQPCFRALGGKPGDHPVAEQAAATSLALPVFEGLTEGEQIEVVGTIAEFARRR
jgi:dTDP-4-amino-4,6-dideoxygalactose transaminase